MSRAESHLMKTTDTTFEALQLSEPILRALKEKNYTHPSPIQAGAIPPLLAGKDLVGVAQTGTGKTAAFALPILHRLQAHPVPRVPCSPRVLILTPTRELAAQIGDNFAAYGRHLPLRHAVIFGGVGQMPQVMALSKGIDILVATPGRLLDLHQQGHMKFGRVEIFVLDEADRMLDMGFVHDVKKVMAHLPARRQSLLFSATMPPAIQEIADRLLREPVRVEVTPVASTAERIQQRICHVPKEQKRNLLVHLIQRQPEGLILVFVRMKHGANRLVEQLARAGIAAEAIHGNKSQGARLRALENFRTGKSRVLVATDIAARGIDVKGITLVVNYDIPNEPESYVHRIGRTARAGAEGVAYSLCEPAERAWLRDIERLIRMKIETADHPFGQNVANQTPAGPAPTARPAFGGGRSQNRRRPGGRPAGRHQGSRSGAGRPGEAREEKPAAPSRSGPVRRAFASLWNRDRRD